MWVKYSTTSKGISYVFMLFRTNSTKYLKRKQNSPQRYYGISQKEIPPSAETEFAPGENRIPGGPKRGGAHSYRNIHILGTPTGRISGRPRGASWPGQTKSGFRSERNSTEWSFVEAEPCAMGFLWESQSECGLAWSSVPKSRWHIVHLWIDLRCRTRSEGVV